MQGGAILYLVRHGETDWNRQRRFQGREDIPMNRAGVRQAQQCGAALAHLGIQAVAASPLRRAVQTAHILAQRTGVEQVVCDPGLIERDLGEFSGQLVQARPDYFAAKAGSGMEPIEQVGRRMQQALLRWQGTAGPVALVSHGAAINVLLRRVSGGQVGTGKTVLKNCGVSVLWAGQGRLELLACNLSAEQAGRFAAP